MRTITSLLLALGILFPSTGHPSEVHPLLEGEKWEEASRLIDEQKLRSAREVVEELFETFRNSESEESWARALVLRSMLEISLAGGEAGVLALQEYEWPPNAEHQVLLRLYLASSLRGYQGERRSGGRQNDLISTDEDKKLRDLTRTEVDSLIDHQYSKAWELRDRLPDGSLSPYSALVQPGERLEGGIYDSFRELIAYEWAYWLVDRQRSRRARQKRMSRDELGALLLREAGDVAALHEFSELHVVRACRLLDLLESECIAEGRSASAFEARLAKVRMLSKQWGDSEWAGTLADVVTEELSAARRHPRYSMGAHLAGSLLKSAEREREAMAVLRAGAAAYPASEGGQRCKRLAEEISWPRVDLQVREVVDSASPSYTVGGKNVDHLTLSLYKIDPETFRLLQNRKQKSRWEYWVESVRSPDTSWKVELPDTGDYRWKRRQLTLPIEEPGQYAIRASFTNDADSAAVVSEVVLFQSSPYSVTLLADSRQDRAVQVLERSHGAAAEGVEVELLRMAPGGTSLASTMVTDRHGVASFDIPLRESHDSERGVAYELRCEAEDHVLLLTDKLQRAYRRPDGSIEAIFTTDRQIYRPEQDILFKVQLLERDAEQDSFSIAPRREVTVRLSRRNDATLDSLRLRTNDFGSAEGRFPLPATLPLGEYYLKSDLGGAQRFQVEEYKRPSYRIQLEEGSDLGRVGQPVTVRGRATYYFGQGVSGGKGEYRITRTVRYPSALRYQIGHREKDRWSKHLTLSGSFDLNPDGRFEFTFPTEPGDSTAHFDQLSFRYRVVVDITSDTGETKSASQTLSLATTAVRAKIDLEHDFIVVGEDILSTVTRLDPQGWIEPGQGRFEIRRLKPGIETARFELPEGLGRDLNRRLDDWGEFPWRELSRNWTDGELATSGTLNHGATGEASIRWKPDRAGSYRLRYHTEDPWGKPYVNETIFHVFDGGESHPLPLYLAAEPDEPAIGDSLRIVVGSSIPGQHLYLLGFSGKEFELLEHFVSDGRPRILKIPVTPRWRGAVRLSLHSVHASRGARCEAMVRPQSHDRELHVLAEQFGDSLRAGEDVTWAFQVVDADSQGVEAELLVRIVDASLAELSRFGAYDALHTLLFPRQPTGRIQFALSDWGRSHSSGRHHSRGRIWELQRPVPYHPRSIGLKGRFMSSHVAASSVSAFGREEIFVRGGRSKEVSLSIDEVGLAGEGETPMSHREDFRETALFLAHVRTDASGRAEIRFRAPEAPGAWKVDVVALSDRVQYGKLAREARTVKPLMVRVHPPRFLRTRDTFELTAGVANQTDTILQGVARLGVDTGRAPSFEAQHWELAPKSTSSLTWRLRAPDSPGALTATVEATGQGHYDGEQRRLPVLPASAQLSRTAHVLLDDRDAQRLTIPEMSPSHTPRSSETLRLTVHAQPMVDALIALDWLLSRSHGTTDLLVEQLVLSRLYSRILGERPDLARSVEQLESLRATDESRRSFSGESIPWTWEDPLKRPYARRLSSRNLTGSFDLGYFEAIRAISERQDNDGGIPWFEGGEPDLRTTLRFLELMALFEEKVADLGLDHDRKVLQKAWNYVGKRHAQRNLGGSNTWRVDLVYTLGRHFREIPEDTPRGMRLAMLPTYAGIFTNEEIVTMADALFDEWKSLSLANRLKMAMTYGKLGMADRAELLLESVLDLAVEEPDGTLNWRAPAEVMPEDPVAGHALALRSVLELAPEDARLRGLEDWLLMNRDLSGWSGTRATTEALLAFAKSIELGRSLDKGCRVSVRLGAERASFRFKKGVLTTPPSLRFTGDSITPAMRSGARVKKLGKGRAYITLTWSHDSDEGSGAIGSRSLEIAREMFLRERIGDRWRLRPLDEVDRIAPGDQIEIQLRLRAHEPVEYVLLTDPRFAGCEPERIHSGILWEHGSRVRIEPRDVATRFYFRTLPEGETLLRHRVRVVSPGVYSAPPAGLEPFYGAEWSATSAPMSVTVQTDK